MLETLLIVSATSIIAENWNISVKNGWQRGQVTQDLQCKWWKEVRSEGPWWLA